MRLRIESTDKSGDRSFSSLSTKKCENCGKVENTGNTAGTRWKTLCTKRRVWADNWQHINKHSSFPQVNGLQLLFPQTFGQSEPCGFPLSPEQVFALIFHFPCCMEAVFQGTFHRLGENTDFSTFFPTYENFSHGYDLCFSIPPSVFKRFFTVFHRVFPTFRRVFNTRGK